MLLYVLCYYILYYQQWNTGPIFSYKLRYIVGFWLVEMAITTNQKLTICRNLYDNTGPVIDTVYYRKILIPSLYFILPTVKYSYWYSILAYNSKNIEYITVNITRFYWLWHIGNFDIFVIIFLYCLVCFDATRIGCTFGCHYSTNLDSLGCYICVHQGKISATSGLETGSPGLWVNHATNAQSWRNTKL